jgi:XTP/dITP diphosphohydrolase
MQKILIATHNFGKYKELMEVLEELPFKFVSLNDENIDGDVEENGETYEENAILKAEHFGRLAAMPTIADDSGIIVDALTGELGVQTRRWGAGPDASDEVWLNHFLNRLAEEENRRAEFISVVAFYRPNKETLTFRGECIGQILNEPQIDLEPGIPLSAVFLPEGKNHVFSALSNHEKNEISHRGKAIKQCHDFLLKHFT